MTKQQGGGRQGKPARDAEVVSITDAGAAHSDEIRARMIKYATAMGIRMVCLVLVFVVDPWWLKILMMLGAVVLPWIAVVIANGGDMADAPSEHLIGVPLQGELPAQPTEDSGTGEHPDDDGVAPESAGAGSAPEDTVIEGEILGSTDSPADDRKHRGDAA